MNRKAFRGFSLVELVIVIVIIGIIAAIAIPRVSRGSKGAGDSALAQNLAVLRNALELYASEHDGTYPGAVGDGTNAAGTQDAFENQLTQYTKADGTVKATYDAANGFIYGPYLRKGLPAAPVGAKKGEATVSIETDPAVALAADDSTGWMYNSGTGQIIVNSTATNEAGTDYDSY